MSGGGGGGGGGYDNTMSIKFTVSLLHENHNYKSYSHLMNTTMTSVPFTIIVLYKTPLFNIVLLILIDQFTWACPVLMILWLYGVSSRV